MVFVSFLMPLSSLSRLALGFVLGPIFKHFIANIFSIFCTCVRFSTCMCVNPSAPLGHAGLPRQNKPHLPQHHKSFFSMG